MYCIADIFRIDNMVYKHFTSIVIAGGATKMLCSIGVLRYLEELKLTKYIKNYIGTSAGAIFSAMFAMGFNSNEILEFFDENLCKDNQVKQFNIDDIFNILDTYGLSCGDNLEIFFKRMIIKKLGVMNENITFIEFAKLTGKNLVITVSNLTMEKPEYWSVDTKPNISILKALRASCAIPILFSPIVIDNCYYVDGGLYDNFPINYFQGNPNILKDILGINIKSLNKIEVNNFMDYVKLIVSSTLNKLSCTNYDCKDRNILCLEFEEECWISLLDLSVILPREKIEEYINIGYKKAKESLAYLIPIDTFPQT